MARFKKARALAVHTLRVSLVATLLLLIPPPQRDRIESIGDARPPSLELIQKLVPDAVDVDEESDSNGLWSVRDENGSVIARAARTLPRAADVIGYRGPSEALMLLDDQLKLIGVDLIQSDDTDEHVEAVKSDGGFFEQFQNWTWDGPDASAEIDAVSGATLTSLAMARGVLKRIGGDRPSLVFPDETSEEELNSFFPDSVAMDSQEDAAFALDATGESLGYVIRTGPLSDNVIGYQGPTELLLKIDAKSDNVIEDIKLRSSFDNQPYVRYCKTEYGFWKVFEGKRIEEVAAMDLDAEGVEGVSGATMTSMAIAETLVAATRELGRRAEERESQAREAASSQVGFQSLLERLTSIRLSKADWGCVLTLLLIPLFRAKGWFRQKKTRALWLIAVISVVGCWSGNLISLALLAGWSGGGVAWELAPALALIVFVALLFPPFAKSNPYCNHLCPHGAIQQLVRPTAKSKRHWSPPKKLITLLRYLPGALLVAGYLALLFQPSIDLSSWEPFHAYLFRIAPWTSIAFAAMTLVVSAFVPMGFCRLGCPTGRLIDYLRRSASSDRLGLADGIATMLLFVAVAVSASS